MEIYSKYSISSTIESIKMEDQCVNCVFYNEVSKTWWVEEGGGLQTLFKESLIVS